ncbi:putative F-box protein At5g42430 [Papaver somniferum]|uniref:putative F-box protein At5g42430 n=1 Tax=Papaver somniferum TaxID=3469 RepID=UPI000E70331A|nr:putative F-box protein At5g42430 [Papaver somniferum]
MEEKLIGVVSGSCVYKFGFDPVGKDYKVIDKWKILDEFEIWGVLTVGENTWRKIDEAPPCSIGPSAPSVYVNGFIYWVPNRYTGGDGFIVAFEVGCEKFRALQVPTFIIRQRSDYDGDKVNVCLLEVNGSVAILRRMTVSDIKLWIYGHIDKESSKATAINSGDKNWTEKNHIACSLLGSKSISLL